MEKDFIAVPRPNSEVERDSLSQLFLGPIIEINHNLLGRLHKVSHFRIILHQDYPVLTSKTRGHLQEISMATTS